VSSVPNPDERCSNCAAPLDPNECEQGELLRCENCGQSHRYLGPGELEAQPAPVDAGYRRLLLVAVGAVVTVVALMVVVGFVLARRAGARTPLEAPLGPDMPIAIGDALPMRIDALSCTVDVLDVLADGRILGTPCAASEPSLLVRERLGVEAFPESARFRSLGAGDVVLARTHAGWLRGVVIGVEPGARVSIRPLGTPSAALHLARSADVVRVQPASSSGKLYVPLPDEAPLAAGDVYYRRQGRVLVAVRVLDPVAPELRVETGSSNQGRFSADGRPAAPVARALLLAVAVRVHEPLEAGSRVLIRASGAWFRRKVVRDEGGALSVTPEGGGAEEVRPKRDVLLVKSLSQSHD
jgi:hypothetical protein